MSQIHPTAVVDSSARIADDVEIGPYCVIEADVQIGPGCSLDPHCVIKRYTRMGKGNHVGSFSVLGQWPQDMKFDPDRTSYVAIGDNNRFGEYVTISRATGQDGSTRVDNGTFWMAGAHLGHEGQVCDGAILANNVQIGGHATVGPECFMGGGSMVHQFCWVGRRVMAQGISGVSMHVPPFVMTYSINRVAGLNRVGLRRDEDISPEDIRQIREAFNITYRRKLPMGRVIEQLNACTDFGPPADEFRQFVIRVYQAQPPFGRGLCPFVPERRR